MSIPNVEPAVQSKRLHQLLHTLGRAYLQKDQYAEAFDKFTQLLALEPNNPEFLLDAAIAALGANDVSPPTLALYEKALAKNPDASALKLGLASLFVHQNLAIPFAIALCESAVELAPDNEQQIRLYLKNHYEATGLLDKARAEEQKAIFNSRDGKAIRAYLAKLWWEGQFNEAYQALGGAPKANGAYGYITKELAMTHAYEMLASDRTAESLDTIKVILAAVPSLMIADSLVDLRDYLTLRLSLMSGTSNTYSTPPAPEPHSFMNPGLDREKLQNGAGEVFAVTPFNLQEELLIPLNKPAGWQENLEQLDGEWQGFLFTQIVRYDGKIVPERLRNLLSAHLAQLPDSLVRQSGVGFISLVKDPALQIHAMVDFMQSLEDYNAAVPESERVMLISALQTTRQLHKGSDRETLVALVEAAHCLRYAEQIIAIEASVGILLLHAEDEVSFPPGRAGTTLIPMEAVPLLPGRKTTCAEVVWRNPLAHLKPGQVYAFGRFEVRQRLRKHNSYVTYLAHDLQLDRPLVMKVILPAEASRLLQNEEQRHRVYGRIRAIARLSHPHLAFLYDMGEHEGMLFYGREYIEGKNLTELHFRDEQRDGEILAMLQKIVRALSYANSKGVVHLNLKPGNIWLSAAQELKITDFHIPGFVEDNTNSSVPFSSHWRYLAPEILHGESGDPRSDIYSLGIMAYELLAGRHPYDTAGAIYSPKDVFRGDIAPLEAQEKPHHRAWDDFVMKAIARDADQRFGDLTAMEQELRAIQMEMLKRALNSGR